MAPAIAISGSGQVIRRAFVSPKLYERGPGGVDEIAQSHIGVRSRIVCDDAEPA